MDVHGQDSSIYFGEVKDEEVDWRAEDIDEEDPDDELLEETPADVIGMLGFDPKDL